MSHEHPIRLTGLDPLDPLGYLAALGVLVAADEQAGAKSQDAPRLCFQLGGLPVPLLYSTHASIEELLDCLEQDLDQLAGRAAGFDRDPFLAFSYVGGKGDAVRDLKPSPTHLRARLLEMLADSTVPETTMDWFTATMTDVAVDGNGNTKPFALHFTAGNQKFLTIATELLDGADGSTTKEDSPKRRVGRDDLAAATFGPWPQDRALKVFSWSPTQDRPYAHRALDPASDQKLGTPGADWLALRGLCLLSSAPVGNAIRTSGVHGRWKNGSFTYPIWPTAMDRGAVKAILRHPACSPGDALNPGDPSTTRTLPRGVELLTARISRHEQGGYGSFSRPDRR